MKRKTEITYKDLLEAVIQLKNEFIVASPKSQQKILLQLSELIGNLQDKEISDIFAKVHSFFESIAKPTTTDLEQIEQTKDDNSAFFESEEKHRIETIQALEEIKKPEARND